MIEHTHTEEITDCSDRDCLSGKRNRYFRNKKMLAEDFSLEQSYNIKRRRLLNRALHGWGVVYGLKIELDQPKSNEPVGRIRVGKGLALDKHGRELVVADELALRPIDMFVAKADGGSPLPGKWLLSAHYAERPMDPFALPKECDCGTQEWNHLCETVIFSLSPVVEDKHVAEDSCPHCGCPDDPKIPSEIIERGPHRCLCHWSTHAQGPNSGDDLCKWKDYWIDAEHGVALAVVTIEEDDGECKDLIFKCVEDACDVRRLVKRSDLLFDLIRGCDLTRIEKIAWHNWHRQQEPVPWATFRSWFHMPKANECPTGFIVHFSGPVLRETLTLDCVSMTIILPESEGGWWETLRVPIIGVKPDDSQNKSDDPPNTTRGAQVFVDAGWVDDVIDGKRSNFQLGQTTAEIEIRGDYILDCRGQAVDANSIGFVANGSGNATPGGTFLSVFRVEKKNASS